MRRLAPARAFHPLEPANTNGGQSWKAHALAPNATALCAA